MEVLKICESLGDGENKPGFSSGNKCGVPLNMWHIEYGR